MANPRNPNLRLALLAAIGSLSIVLAACGGPTEGQAVADAQRKLARKDVDGAIIELKNLLAKNPGSGLARAALGDALLAKGDVAGAEAEYERALQSDAKADRILPGLSRALLLQRKYQQVARLEGGAQLTEPRPKADFAVNLALATQAEGNLDQANMLITEALRLVPDHVPALVAETRLLAQAGNTQMAAQRARSLAERFPSEAQVQLLHADALAASDDRSAAEAYEKALQIDGRLEGAHVALIQLALRRPDLAQARSHADRMSQALKGQLMPLYYDALVAYMAGDHLRARERLQQLLKNVDDHPPSVMLAGMTEKRLGAYTQADALLSKALLAMPDSGDLRRESAEVLVLLGQPQRALERLKPGLQASGGAAPDWTLAGRAHAMLGDFKSADAAFARARALKPADPAPRLAYARSLLARGNPEFGLRELQAVAQGEDGLQALIDLVPALVQRKDWAGALAAIDRLAQRSPRSPLPDLVKGQVLQEKGDLPAARLAYESALAKDGNYVVAVDRLARLDASQSGAESAVQRWKAFLKKQPRSAPALLALGELLRQQGRPHQEVQPLLDEAVAAQPSDVSTWLGAIELERRSGQIQPWRNRAQRAAAALPDDPDVAVALAQALRAAGDMNQSLAVLQRAAIARPHAVALRLELADAHLANNEIGAARAAVNQAREIDSRSLVVERAHVRLLVREGRTDEALKAAESRRAAQPRDADSILLEAEMRRLAGHATKTVALLREALTVAPSTPVAMRLSDELRRNGRSDEAESFEQDWMRRNPLDAGFVGHLAQQAAARGDLARAEVHYRKVVSLEPQAALSLNNLATLLMDGKPGEALAFARQAAKLMPNSPPILDTLAHALAANSLLPQAVNVQTRAVEIEPQSVPLRLSLIRLQIRAGERDKARAMLERLADRGDTGPEAEEVRRLMSELKR